MKTNKRIPIGVMLIGIGFCVFAVARYVVEMSVLIKEQEAEIAALSPREHIDDSEHGIQRDNVLIDALIPGGIGALSSGVGFLWLIVALLWDAERKTKLKQATHAQD